jgi:hypothetical protein
MEAMFLAAHGQVDHGLAVRPSQLGDFDGLFATQAFKDEEFICQYEGEAMLSSEFERGHASMGVALRIGVNLTAYRHVLLQNEVTVTFSKALRAPPPPSMPAVSGIVDTVPLLQVVSAETLRERVAWGHGSVDGGGGGGDGDGGGGGDGNGGGSGHRGVSITGFKLVGDSAGGSVLGEQWADLTLCPDPGSMPVGTDHGRLRLNGAAKINDNAYQAKRPTEYDVARNNAGV